VPPVSKRQGYKSSFAGVALDPCLELSRTTVAKRTRTGEYGLAYFTLAQSAAETVAEPMLAAILQILTEDGLSRRLSEGISAAFAARRLPVGPKPLVQRLVELYAAFSPEEQERLQSPLGVFQTLNFEIDDDNQGRAPGGEVFSETLGGRYVIVSGLGRPIIVSGSDWSGKLFYPATFLTDKDDVSCIEIFDARTGKGPSYSREDVAGTSFIHPFRIDFRSSPVPFDTLDNYRRNINDPQPVPFWERIAPPWPDIHVMTLQTFESMDSDLAEMLRRLLEDNKDKIDEQIQKAQNEASGLVTDLATSAGAALGGALGPQASQLGGAVGKLAGQVVSKLLHKLRELLLDLLDGADFENWTFSMSVVPSGGLPLCYATFHRAGRATAAFQTDGDGVLEDNGSPDYRDPARWKLPQRFLLLGRRFFGPTTEPSQPPSFRLWAATDARNEPIIWSNSDGSEGLQALLPVHQIAGAGRYVWSGKVAILPESGPV
jgi:hypothetical protein